MKKLLGVLLIPLAMGFFSCNKTGGGGGLKIEPKPPKGLRR
jgi:hypothetical protein